MKRLFLIWMALLPALGACGQGPQRQEAEAADAAEARPAEAVAPAAEVLLGIEVLEKSGFECLQGKKIGLLTNRSGIDRKELFITTKIFPEDIINGTTAGSFEQSLEKLDTDYVDLMFLHQPVEIIVRIIQKLHIRIGSTTLRLPMAN